MTAQPAEQVRGEFKSARVIIEVMAGLLPGKDPDPQYTRRYHITSEEWAAAGEGQSALLAERNGTAMGYASLLMLLPNQLNWVRVDWIWP